MPLPTDLHDVADALEVRVEGQGVWRSGAWTGASDPLPLWVLPLGPLSRDGKEPELAQTDVEHRLAQARIAWHPVVLNLGGEAVEAIALESVNRAKAVALGYRLGRWAVLRVGTDTLTVVYTGLGSRMDR